jgi:hypothetical protein
MLLFANHQFHDPTVDNDDVNSFYPGTPTGTGVFYWTSTPYLEGVNQYWNLNIWNGLINFTGQLNTRYVRCISGPAVPNPVYTEITNNFSYWTVLDETTNLIWTKCSISGTTGNPLDDFGGSCNSPVPGTDNIIWTDALSTCENSSYGGSDNWRLPSLRELASIIKHDVAIGPYIDDIFPKTYNDRYWTSTSRADFGTIGRDIIFTTGQIAGNWKTLFNFVRCVRDGP